MKRCAGGPLDAMVRPENLIAVRKLDSIERFFVFMARGERMVPGRVPVLGQHDVFEVIDETIDHRDDFVASRDGQRPSREKVVLRVYYDKGLHVLKTI